MKRFSALPAALLALVCCAGHFISASAQGAPSWITLFDGKNLNAFHPVGTANWKIVDGVLQADSGTGFLVTTQPYGDFEIKAEFWVDEPANSGIFLRCDNSEMITADTCYEVNVFDTRPDPAYGTGAIVNVAKPTTILKAGGKWNTYRSRRRGLA